MILSMRDRLVLLASSPLLEFQDVPLEDHPPHEFTWKATRLR